MRIRWLGSDWGGVTVVLQWRLGWSTGCGERHRGQGCRRHLDEALLAGDRQLRRLLFPVETVQQLAQSVVPGVLAGTFQVLHQRCWPWSQIQQKMHWSATWSMTSHKLVTLHTSSIYILSHRYSLIWKLSSLDPATANNMTRCRISCTGHELLTTITYRVWFYFSAACIMCFITSYILMRIY